jgi:hypothetical protein
MEQCHLCPSEMDKIAMPILGFALAWSILGAVTYFEHIPTTGNWVLWYDWAMIHWDKESGQCAHSQSREDSCVHYGDDVPSPDYFRYAPGKILGFVFDRHPAAFPVIENVQAAVLCCNSSHSKSSVFTTHWKVSCVDKAFTQPLITMVSVNAIVQHCLMVPENDDAYGYHGLGNVGQTSFMQCHSS